MDEFSARYADLLTGSYDCVDRIVLNAYYPLGHNPGGFRVWWRRWHDDGDDSLGRRASDAAGRPVRPPGPRLGPGERGAGDRLRRRGAQASDRRGLSARPHGRRRRVLDLGGAGAGDGVEGHAGPRRSGTIRNLEKTRQFVNHYSFHIMDPTWGHLTIKMSGHPPFGAQVILNGHEYVACAAHAAEIGFAKEGNCFTGIGEPERLAQIADTLSQPGTAGRLGQVIDAWIYTACLCFGLDLAEQQASDFHYAYSVYQVEYSRNLIFDSRARWNGCSTRSSTGPGPGSTCPRSAPCSASGTGPAGPTRSCRPGKGW